MKPSLGTILLRKPQEWAPLCIAAGSSGQPIQLWALGLAPPPYCGGHTARTLFQDARGHGPAEGLHTCGR